MCCGNALGCVPVGVAAFAAALLCGKNPEPVKLDYFSLFFFHVGKRLAGCRHAALGDRGRLYHTLDPLRSSLLVV